MERVSDSQVYKFQKAMLKGGLAAAAPGLVAIVAAFTVPVSLLNQAIGMGIMGEFYRGTTQWIFRCL